MPISTPHNVQIVSKLDRKSATGYEVDESELVLWCIGVGALRSLSFSSTVC